MLSSQEDKANYRDQNKKDSYMKVIREGEAEKALEKDLSKRF